MPLQTLHPLAMSPHPGGKQTAQPLPAEEQLALLFRLAESKSPIDVPGDLPDQTLPPLAEAYEHCERMTRQHSKSFYFSTQFLPPDKRQAVRVLYAFCRTSDDTVDLAEDDPARALADWVRRARSPIPQIEDPVLLAWHDVRSRYNLAPHIIDELLAGVAMDLTINRYETFADLWLYCYRVASVVGLLSMQIVGTAPGAEPYAIKLGVALQCTNILRDVGEDAARGRVYLPEEDLQRFGLRSQDILNRVCDKRFAALMNFEIERTRQLYNESWPGIALLSSDSRLAVGAAARTYQGILDKVIANDYDVYRQRAYLTLAEKIMLLPTIWFSVSRLGRSTPGRKHR